MLVRTRPARSTNIDLPHEAKDRLAREIAAGSDFLKGRDGIQDPGIMRLRMTSFQMVIPVAGVPTKVLDQNLNRLRLVIPNTTGSVIFISFDPSDMNGIPVNNNVSYQETVGTVTCDPIYVRTSVNAATTVRVYEGVRLTTARGS